MTQAPSRVEEIKRHQKIVFLMGAAAAAIPMICQGLVLAVFVLAPEDFPKADTGLSHAKFWPVQIVLLCVAICGNAIVDFAKLICKKSAANISVVSQFFLMIFGFLVVSIQFSVALLNTNLGWSFLAAMFIFALVDLWLAYRVEMDIALIEAGLLGE